MHGDLDRSFFTKVDAFRLFAILGVMVIHATNYEQFRFLQGTTAYTVEVKTVDSVSWAVSLFFLISAYLMFRNFQWNLLLDKWKRRIHSLLIPYLVWNAINFILFALLPRIPFFAQYINSQPASLTVNEFLSAIFLHRYNYFLWFLQALIEFTLLAPLFFIVFSRKIWSEISLIVLFLLMLFRPVPIPQVLSFDWRACFYYAAGVYLALRAPNVPLLSPPAPARILLLYLIPIAIIVNIFYSNEVFYMIFIACLWYGLPAERFHPRRIYSMTFFLYLVHILVFSIIKKIQYAILPHTQLFMLVSFFTVIPISLLFLVPLAYLFKKWMPRTYGFLFGSR